MAWNSFPLEIIYQIFGWIAFFSWSISFYPQVILNYRRKSVVGLNFDFVVLNLTKHSTYLIYNATLYFSSVVQRQYRDKYGRDEMIPVAANDVAFSIHAVLLTAFTLFQIFIYERGIQKVSKISFTLVIAAWGIAAVCVFIALPSHSWLWLITVFKPINNVDGDDIDNVNVDLVSDMPIAENVDDVDNIFDDVPSANCNVNVVPIENDNNAENIDDMPSVNDNVDHYETSYMLNIYDLRVWDGLDSKMIDLIVKNGPKRDNFVVKGSKDRFSRRFTANLYTRVLLNAEKCDRDWLVKGSWVNFYGNIGKTLLSLVSIFFDLLFMVQHYVLYRNKPIHRSSKLDEANDEALLKSSDLATSDLP
uniref:Cystinosin homolog n=1 Tax=Chenopodium quinoa TaxID=63459 RepID=A0A803LSQ1_CHEQI